MLMSGLYKGAIRYFSGIGMKYFPKYLSPLREEIMRSNLGILFEMYVGRMIFISFLSFVALLISVSALLAFLGLPLLLSIASGFIVATTIAFVVLTLFHSYPMQLITSKKHNIEDNMPFAINHMSAIASSGVPPFLLFKILSSVKDYREVANECSRISRNIDAFGMDVTSAVKNVADRTPSYNFRQFLYGIVSTIETGGNLEKFLDNSAKEAMFDYRLKREKYTQTLSTYADFYTAVLIAAPLFFVSILSIMSLIGGQIFGLSIPMAMRLGIYVLIPVLNIAFIMFIHYTQPTV